MIKNTLSLLSVNKTIADFTFWACVAVAVCAYCQNVHCLVSLQRWQRCYDLLRSSQNIANLRTDMYNAACIWRENISTHH
jgi:hypothetical protein